MAMTLAVAGRSISAPRGKKTKKKKKTDHGGEQ